MAPLNLQITISGDAEDTDWLEAEAQELAVTLQRKADERRARRIAAAKREKRQRVNVCPICGYTVITKDVVSYSVCQGRSFDQCGGLILIDGGTLHMSARMNITSYIEAE